MIKLNGQEIEFSKFPNGEALVDTELLNKAENGCRIDFKWEKDEDILHLYFVLGHLQDRIIRDKKIYIYYMPYSRMDRSESGSCYTLIYVCELLNMVLYKNAFDMVYDDIYIVEPHSDKTLELLCHSKRINAITPLMQKICSIENVDVICYPDKGAKARFCDDKVNNLPVVYCEKVRDFDTGEIKGLELKSDIDLNGKNVLILDDLCSKGGTFYYTAKKLKEKGANDVFLGVCHMEKSVMGGQIVKYDDHDTVIKHIYCFNTMINGYGDITNPLPATPLNITIYDIEKFLNEGVVEE